MGRLHYLFLTLWLVPLMLSWPGSSSGQELEVFKKWQAKVAQYKRQLDSVGPKGSGLWLRLDGSRRPHRLYVGQTFHKKALKTKEEFIELFSHFLAGHPDKFMLIDIFDTLTGRHIGEFGWGGFKLYPLKGLADKEPAGQRVVLDARGKQPPSRNP